MMGDEGNALGATGVAEEVDADAGDDQQQDYAFQEDEYEEPQ